MPLALGVAVLCVAVVLLMLTTRLGRDDAPAWAQDFAVGGTLAALVVSGFAFGAAFVVEGLVHPGLATLRPMELGLEVLVIAAAALGIAFWRSRSRRMR
jgi:hypothetical protein